MVSVGAIVSVEDEEIIVPEPQNVLNWSVTASDVITGCLCKPIPSTLLMNHNFDKLDVFSEFLTRNNLILPESIDLRYSTSNSKWERNYHFSGVGELYPEKWILRAEWFCTNVEEGMYTGVNTWRFEFVLRKIENGQNYIFKIINNITDSSNVCTGKTMNVFMEYNKILDIFSVNNNLIITGHVIDDIGAVAGSYWADNLLSANITEAEPELIAETMPLTAFMPEKSVTIFGRT